MEGFELLLGMGVLALAVVIGGPWVLLRKSHATNEMEKFANYQGRKTNALP